MPRRNKLLATAGVTLALALAIPAIAYGKPESILPPGFGEPAPAPSAPTPATEPSTTTPAAPVATGPAESGGVQEVNSLTPAETALVQQAPRQVSFPPSARRDAAMAGVLDPEGLGIGDRPWGGMSGKSLEIILRGTRAPIASRWAHIGLRSALLAKVAAPVGVNPIDWAAERSWLLLRMGEADAGSMLVAAVDSDRYTPKMKQVALQAALASADPSAMCAVEPSVSKVEPRVSALVSAICASLSGEPERAAADIQTVRRRGRLQPIDIALADKVVGAGAETGRAVTIEWEPVEALNSWRFGLAASTGMMPPQKLIDAAPVAMRSWLARSPIYTADQKIPSARIAAASGVFSSQALVDLYAAAYDAADPDNLGSTDAWQLKLAYVGEDLSAKMDAMRRLWGVDKESGDKMAGYVLLARAARHIAPSADLESDAPNLIASLLAGGFDREAARWNALVGDFDDQYGDPAWAMLALGAPKVDGLTVSESRIGKFAGRDQSEDKVRTGLLIAGLAGLGRIDTDAINSLNREHELGLGAKTAWTNLIDGAASRGQAGTVLVLAGSALQGGDIRKVKPIYLFHVVSALRKTGQDYLARMIAAEALARA